MESDRKRDDCCENGVEYVPKIVDNGTTTCKKIPFHLEKFLDCRVDDQIAFLVLDYRLERNLKKFRKM